jgi:hypothetical protein
MRVFANPLSDQIVGYSAICFATAAALLALAGAARAADDASAICKTIASRYEAGIASGDSGVIAAGFTSDGQDVTPWGVFVGTEAIAKFYAGGIKPGAKETVTVTSARMLGDLVFCVAGYNFTGASGGPPSKGFFSVIAGKVGNDWKTQSQTWNVTPPQ